MSSAPFRRCARDDFFGCSKLTGEGEHGTGWEQEEQTRKGEQKKLSAELMVLMKTSEIDEVDINNGKLIYAKKNVKKPITKKALLSILSKFYEGDIAKATEINDFIIENREEAVVESIVRKIKDS